jgi:hypothetical protein
VKGNGGACILIGWFLPEDWANPRPMFAAILDFSWDWEEGRHQTIRGMVAASCAT